MIIYSVIGIVLLIALTLNFIGNRLENMLEQKKIDEKGYSVLRNMNLILYVFSAFILIVIWWFVMNTSTKGIIITLILLIIDAIILAIYKAKLTKIKKRTQKRNIIKGDGKNKATTK